MIAGMKRFSNLVCELQRWLACSLLGVAGTLSLLGQDAAGSTGTNAAPAGPSAPETSFPLKVVGVTVKPHQMPDGIQFAYQGEQLPGGRVEIFIQNTAPIDSQKPEDTVNVHVLQFNGNEPKRNVFNNAWSWEDTPSEWPENDTVIPPSALTVFSFNSLMPSWIEENSSFSMLFTDWLNSRKNSLSATIPNRDVHLSSICFLSNGIDPLRPDSLVFYIENESQKVWKVLSVQIYQPYLTTSFRMMRPIATLDHFNAYPPNKMVLPGQKMVAIAKTPGQLKLTSAVIKITLINPARTYETQTLWEHLRVRRESFDIGAGWISTMAGGTNTLTMEPYLKTLKRLHINVANIQNIPGYTDQTNVNGLYTLYPLKEIGPMQPLPQFDTDTSLPNIYAAESLGNVQDSINSCSPQDALELLRVYGGFRIPTALILTDPWKWRHYAGISDYPLFNVSRLAIPNEFEQWELYTRWEKPIPWAAPLETLGSLTRNLRDINRPISSAAWIQGPFDGWTTEGLRKRLAPTPAELRSLAWHVLSARVSSFHWFNLNISSLVKYRDLLSVIQNVDREARLLEVFFLYGDSWEHSVQLTTEDEPAKPDWELSSIICPRGALLCALDVNYDIDRWNSTFKFKRPRDVHFSFSLPKFLASPLDVFRVDANGIYDVAYQVTDKGVDIMDKQSLVALYIATYDRTLRGELRDRLQGLLKLESYYNFDPANNRKDFDTLKTIARRTGNIIIEEPIVEDIAETKN